MFKEGANTAVEAIGIARTRLREFIEPILALHVVTLALADVLQSKMCFYMPEVGGSPVSTHGTEQRAVAVFFLSVKEDI